ncbi:TetR family transcriptional regulator [Brevibacillus panacihumi]|uniref:TetR family transcriptional regulator n=1 Tax=Brevibacillus panacihumi TaxID=497735 RepID=UPI003D24612D
MAPKVSEEYKQQKKTELLQAAKQVFIKKGYTNATMQDILDEAGVSRGALYAYFDNLEHVYIELLRYEDQQDILCFTPDDERTSWQQIISWLDKQRMQIKQMDQSLLVANSEFFLSVRENKAGYPYISDRYQRLVEVLIAFIQAGAERGDLAPRFPQDSIARYLISFIDGLMLDTAHLGQDKTNVDEQCDLLLFSLKEMLRPVSTEETP